MHGNGGVCRTTCYALQGAVPYNRFGALHQCTQSAELACLWVAFMQVLQRLGGLRHPPQSILVAVQPLASASGRSACYDAPQRAPLAALLCLHPP